MSSSTANQINVSQLKLQLQSVIGNIKVLEELEGAANAISANLMQTEVVQVISRQTSDLLQQLEKQTKNGTSLLKCVEKRKSKRLANKLNKTKNKKIIKQTARALKQATSTATERSATAIKSLIFDSSGASKPHHQLRNYHAAQRQLRSLELLEMLHAARGQNAADTHRFATQLRDLRAVWNSILQENKPQRSHELKIEQQWSEVYFGSSMQSYYGSKLKMNEFLNRRETWDSYLTRSSKNGTSIPSGWVLPKANADARWLQYISK